MSGQRSGIFAIQRDLSDLRDIFVGISDIVGSVFAFMGHETAVLVLWTLLFLFVINLIPFFFFDKKQRYYAGIGFGAVLGFWFSYSVWAILKFIGIMLLPLALEYVVSFVFRKTGAVFLNFLKKTIKTLWRAVKALIKRVFTRKKKDAQDVSGKE